MAKKILFSLFSVFLIAQSYDLITKVHHFSSNNLALIFFAAWIINMFITGIFAFLTFAFPAYKLLPKSYYKIQAPQTLIKVYQWLRVDVFRKMLLATVWRNQEMRAGFFNGKKSGILNLEERSLGSEFGHIVPFVIIMFVVFYLFSIGLMKLGIFTLLLNVAGNLYPVILQRHHRMRIERIRARQRQQSKIRD